LAPFKLRVDAPSLIRLPVPVEHPVQGERLTAKEIQRTARPEIDVVAEVEGHATV